MTLSIFPYAFRPDQLARCYRNLGFYFSEKALWEPASTCFHMSLTFEPKSTNAMSELYYIQHKSGRMFPEPSPERMKEIGNEYDFPIGPNHDVLGLSFAYGKHFAEEGNTEGAKYCWEITYALTGDEKIRELIDQLPGNKVQ